MLTKFNNNKVRWIATTYDDFNFYWSDAEYEVYKKAIENSHIKTLHFKDGSLAISDIRRVEVYNPPKTFEERTGIDSGAFLSELDESP